MTAAAWIAIGQVLLTILIVPLVRKVLEIDRRVTTLEAQSEEWRRAILRFETKVDRLMDLFIDHAR